MLDRRPPMPKAHPSVRQHVENLLPNLYADLRGRHMNESREDPRELSYAVEREIVGPLARALDACVRSDSALWASFEGCVVEEQVESPFGLLLWPGWLLLRIRAK